MKARLPAFLGLILLGTLLSSVLILFEAGRNLPPTAAPLFELLGKPLKTADAALTRILPIDEVDEAELGNAIALRYEVYRDESDPDQKYVESLVRHLSRDSHRGFEYRVFILPNPAPNASAAPGGVLFVTSGLLKMVETESELVSVLGHEIGHVELGHCIDLVRFQLLADKVEARPLGEIADLAVGIMLRPSFSKTQEADADAYGFRMLLKENYNPFGMANAFQKLAERNPDDMESGNPLDEYYRSHPSSTLRARRYRTEATQASIKRYYIGRRNLEERVSRYDAEYPEEWLGTSEED
ncbi:MAG: peptidase M48 [Leptospiraceae bacterium]|nr:peptidase M48 [Leptospiraceae bacterium]